MANNFFNPDEMMEGKVSAASAAKKVGASVIHQAGKQVQKTAKATTSQVAANKAFLEAMYGPSKLQPDQQPESKVEQTKQSAPQHNQPMQQVGGLDDMHASYAPTAKDNQQGEKDPEKKEEQKEKQEKAIQHKTEYYSDIQRNQNPELLSLEQQVRRLHAQEEQKEEQKKKQEEDEKKEQSDQRIAQEKEKEKEVTLRSKKQDGRNRMRKKADTSLAVKRAHTSAENKQGTLG